MVLVMVSTTPHMILEKVSKIQPQNKNSNQLVVSFSVFFGVFQIVFIKKIDANNFLDLWSFMNYRIPWSWIWNLSHHKISFSFTQEINQFMSNCAQYAIQNTPIESLFCFCLVFDVVSKILYAAYMTLIWYLIWVYAGQTGLHYYVKMITRYLQETMQLTSENCKTLKKASYNVRTLNTDRYL